jgi:hypothetical protein
MKPLGIKNDNIPPKFVVPIENETLKDHNLCRNPSHGLVTMARVARLQAKRKTRDSHHMLPRMQRVRGNEPSHSQMNSNVGSWSPKWTPESSKRDCRGQNPSPQKVLYDIGKILKLRCLKWAHIAHLDI